MAKFTKATDKKNVAKSSDKVVVAKPAAGAIKKNNKKQPAVAPAAAKPTAAVKAAIVSGAKPAKAAVQPKQKADKTAKTGHTVYIGNLPTKIKRKHIIKLFKPFGKVSSVRFRRTNGGKIFKNDTATAGSIIGFVDLESAVEVAAAVKALNGTKVGENVVRVDAHLASSKQSPKEKKTGGKPAKAVKPEAEIDDDDEEDAEIDDEEADDSEDDAPAPAKKAAAPKAAAAKNNKKKGGKKVSA